MTPPTASPERDLFLDALRLLVIVLVVAQHWSLPVLSFSAASDTLSMGSVLNAEGGFAVTWIVQVMPLIFFVGGAVNVLSRRAAEAKGTTASEWLAKRLRRLAWPVIPLTAAWIPAAYLLSAAGVPEQPLRVGTEAAGIVLWFLAAYVMVVVATPVLARAEDRFGWLVTGALLAGAALVDTARFATGVDAFGYANTAFVWLGLHQLGFRYSAGAIGRRSAAAMALGGFGAAVALAAFGPYSANMTGVFAVEASNAGPPTLVLAGLGAGQIGLAVLLRDRIAGWVGHPVPARVLNWIGPRLMTVYLWHMAPLSLVAGVLVLGLGMHTPAPLSGAWAVWCLVGAALALPLLCTVVGWAVRFEEPPRALRGDPGKVRIVGAAALTGGGLLLLTTGGLGTGPLPLLGALAVGAGMLATLPAVRLPRPAPVG